MLRYGRQTDRLARPGSRPGTAVVTLMNGSIVERLINPWAENRHGRPKKEVLVYEYPDIHDDPGTWFRKS